MKDIYYKEKQVGYIKDDILYLFVQRDNNANTFNIIETVDVCPLCGFKHRHGSGAGEGSLKLGAGDGFRSKHCHVEPKKGFPLIEYSERDYYIVEQNNEVRIKFEEYLEKNNYPDILWRK